MKYKFNFLPFNNTLSVKQIRFFESIITFLSTMFLLFLIILHLKHNGHDFGISFSVSDILDSFNTFNKEISKSSRVNILPGFRYHNCLDILFLIWIFLVKKGELILTIIIMNWNVLILFLLVISFSLCLTYNSLNKFNLLLFYKKKERILFNLKDLIFKLALLYKKISFPRLLIYFCIILLIACIVRNFVFFLIGDTTSYAAWLLCFNLVLPIIIFTGHFVKECFFNGNIYIKSNFLSGYNIKKRKWTLYILFKKTAENVTLAKTTVISFFAILIKCLSDLGVIGQVRILTIGIGVLIVIVLFVFIKSKAEDIELKERSLLPGTSNQLMASLDPAILCCITIACVYSPEFSFDLWPVSSDNTFRESKSHLFDMLHEYSKLANEKVRTRASRESNIFNYEIDMLRRKEFKMSAIKPGLWSNINESTLIGKLSVLTKINKDNIGDINLSLNNIISTDNYLAAVHSCGISKAQVVNISLKDFKSIFPNEDNFKKNFIHPTYCTQKLDQNIHRLKLNFGILLPADRSFMILSPAIITENGICKIFRCVWSYSDLNYEGWSLKELLNCSIPHPNPWMAEIQVAVNAAFNGSSAPLEIINKKVKDNLQNMALEFVESIAVGARKTELRLPGKNCFNVYDGNPYNEEIAMVYYNEWADHHDDQRAHDNLFITIDSMATNKYSKTESLGLGRARALGLLTGPRTSNKDIKDTISRIKLPDKEKILLVYTNRGYLELIEIRGWKTGKPKIFTLATNSRVLHKVTNQDLAKGSFLLSIVKDVNSAHNIGTLYWMNKTK